MKSEKEEEEEECAVASTEKGRELERARDRRRYPLYPGEQESGKGMEKKEKSAERVEKLAWIDGEGRWFGSMASRINLSREKEGEEERVKEKAKKVEVRFYSFS